LVVSRSCSGHKQSGEPCRVAPLRDEAFCFWHSPEHAEEAAAARKLGGQRRRRESTLAGAYEIGALDTVRGIRRVLEIVTYDGLGMEISVARGRLLIAAMQALTKLLEVGELEERLETVEAALGPRLVGAKGRRR
jgi:hypothetical protein